MLLWALANVYTSTFQHVGSTFWNACTDGVGAYDLRSFTFYYQVRLPEHVQRVPVCCMHAWPKSILPVSALLELATALKLLWWPPKQHVE